jgi:DNA-binding MltR family transcriptional regulator
MSPDLSKTSLSRISPAAWTEPARSAAIIAASLLDDQLEGLLRAYFLKNPVTEELFRGDGPLAAFSTKNRAAYAMGLIPEDLWRDIDKVRRIRNHFAHRIEDIAFDRPPVADIANSLGAAQWIIDHQHLGDSPISPDELKSISESPRRRFDISIGALSVTLDRIRDSLTPAKEAPAAFPRKTTKTA